VTIPVNLDVVRSAVRATGTSMGQGITPPAVAGGVVTIARQAGTGAPKVAARVCELLNERHSVGEQPWLAYDKNLVHTVAEEHELAEDVVAKLDEHDQKTLDEIFSAVIGQPTVHEIGMKTARTIRGLARNGRAVVVGRGGAVILAGVTHSLHVRLVAPLEWRIRAWAAANGVPVDEARSRVQELDRDREDYVKATLNHSADDPQLYDLVVNVAALTVEHTASVIARAVEELHLEDQ
jgi:cytidylate kinase